MKQGIYGQVQIKAGDRVYRKQMKTLTKYAALWFSKLFQYDRDLVGNFKSDIETYFGTGYKGIVNFNYQLIRSNGSGTADLAYPFIYFDYDTNIDGYDKDAIHIPELHVATSANPQRDDFQYYNNKYIFSQWDDVTKKFTLGKIYKNISGSAKTIKRIFIMSPRNSIGGTYGTTTSVHAYVFACDQVDFQVLDGQAVVIKFIITLNGLLYNLCMHFIQKLSPYVGQLTSNPLSRYVKWISNDGQYYQDGRFSASLGVTSQYHPLTITGGAQSIMVLGESDFDVNYEDYSITHIQQLESLSNVLHYDIYYDDENKTYDFKITQYFTNVGQESKTVKQIGFYVGKMCTTFSHGAPTPGNVITSTVFLKDDTTSNSYLNVLLHRHVLSIPIVIQPDETVEMQYYFKFCVDHQFQQSGSS